MAGALFTLQIGPLSHVIDWPANISVAENGGVAGEGGVGQEIDSILMTMIPTEGENPQNVYFGQKNIKV